MPSPILTIYTQHYRVEHIIYRPEDTLFVLLEGEGLGSVDRLDLCKFLLDLLDLAANQHRIQTA